MIRISQISFIVNILALFFIYSQYSLNGILNLQVAFITSSFLIYLTYISYKKNIYYKASLYDMNDRDMLDKIDDRFELFEEEDLNKPKKDNMFKNSVKNFPIFVSLYRIFGYTIFVVGFYLLVKFNLLNIVSYFVGISILPISILIYMLLNYYAK